MRDLVMVYFEYKKNNTITITGVLYVLFIFLSIWLLMDPFYMGEGAFRTARDLGIAKYFGVLMGSAFAFVAFIHIYLNKNRDFIQGIDGRIFYSFLLLFFMILLGSLYARFVNGEKETFIGLSAGMMGFIIGVLAFFSAKDGIRLVERYIHVLLFFTLYAAIWIIIKRLEGGQAFHTEIFLILPLAIFLFMSINNVFIKYVSLFFFVGLAIVSFKFTSFIVIILVVLQLLILGLRKVHKLNTVQKLVLYYFLFLIIIISISGLLFLFINQEHYLPSGSAEYRFYTYGVALNNFFDSPLIGNVFSENGLVYLDGLIVRGNDHVLTHSDVLDLLGNGGLLAVSLFLYVILSILTKAILLIKQDKNLDRKVFVLLNTLISICTAGFMTSMVNSPLVMMVIGTLFWFSLGLLYSIVIRYSGKVTT